MTLLIETVREAGRRFADRCAYRAADGWELSYAALDRISDEAAAGLQRRGVRTGDVVVLLLPSTPDYIVAYLALAKLGAITAGINPGLTVPERLQLLALTGARHVMATGPLAEQVDGDVIEVRQAGHADELLRDLRVPSAGPFEPNIGPDDPIAVVFTSGTSGVPRGAVFADRQLRAIATSELGDGWGGGGAAIAATQFAHVGFMTKLPWSLRLGGTTHLLPRWRAADVLDLVERTRVASIGAVAPQLALMLADPRFDERDLSCVRTVIAGGAASPPALIDEARRRFDASYVVRYSSTESGGIATSTAADADDDEVFHTVGRARSGVEVAIRDGEVCVRSGAVMSAYWNDAPATAEAVRDGWLHTGDLGELDDLGRLRILGRSKEMYIRGGYNVFPVEVEAAVSTHPAIAQVVVVPRRDPVMGETGVAVVVVRPGRAAPTLAELREHARPSIASWKLPEAVCIVEALPMTSGQKVDRRRVAELVGVSAGGADAPTDVHSSSGTSTGSE